LWGNFFGGVNFKRLKMKMFKIRQVIFLKIKKNNILKEKKIRDLFFFTADFSPYIFFNEQKVKKVKE
jgi:hypothetical protein